MSVINSAPEHFGISTDRRGYKWWCLKCGVGRDRGVIPKTLRREMDEHVARGCRHPRTWIAPTGDYQHIRRRVEIRATWT